MAVTFLIGRAGSGKSARIVERLVGACRADPLGLPIFWLLPRQATFMAERELTCRAGGFSRVRVASFDLLGRTIAAECGGAAVPEVTDLGRQMILGHLLRRHRGELRFFAGVAHRPGLAAELDATFAEFERSGKTPAELAGLLKQGPAGIADAHGPALEAKLSDLILLYDEYTRYVGQDRLDRHRRLAQVLEQVGQCKLIRDAAVYVDSFHVFTNYERRILVGLGKACRSVEIALLLDPDSPIVRDPHRLPDDLGLFHRTESTYRRLWFAMTEDHVAMTPPVLLTEGRRFRSEDLARIERMIFRDPAEPERTPSFAAPADLHARLGDPDPPSAAAQSVRFIEAPDPRAEVEVVAREIRSLLRDGLRLRDIAVLVRDLGPYHRLIDTTFREHGIAYFVDRRRSAVHHPLLGFVRSAFQIGRNGWPHPAVMTFLKSGLAGVTLAEADEIENYLLQHRLRGRAWEEPGEWAFHRRLAGEEVELDPAPPPTFESRTMDALRRKIVERLRPLLDLVRGARPIAVLDVAAEAFRTLERFGVRQTLGHWMDKAAAAGDFEERDEHEQVWAELVALFQQMVDLLGDEAVTPAAFVDILESGLERFDLALTPPTVDQILVGQVDRTRPPAVRAAFVLGLNDGSFPSVARDAGILSHVERRELGRSKIELDPDPRRRQLDERFLAYLGVTCPSERLILTRPLVDVGGKETASSSFWEALRGLVPRAPLTTLPREAMTEVRHIATPRQLVTCLMEWGRRPDKAESTSDVPMDSPGRPSS